MKKEHYEKIIEELIKLIDEGVYIVDKQCIGRFYNDIMASMEKVNMDDVLGKRYQDAFPDVRTNDSTMMKALFNGEATVKQQQSYIWILPAGKRLIFLNYCTVGTSL